MAPAAGVAISLKSTAEETDGGWTILEYSAPPRFAGPPAHWHAKTDEAFFVLEGTVRFELDGETVDVQAGGYARVPPGVVHRFSNPSDELSRFLGLAVRGGIERYFEELGEMMASEPSWPPTDMTALMALMTRHDTFPLPGPHREADPGTPERTFEQSTESVRHVVVLAQDEARALKHNYIGTEHILLGLLREQDGIAARVLQSADVTVEEVRAQVARIVGRGDEATMWPIPFTPRAKKVLDLSRREALALGHNYIGSEHVLLGLTRDTDVATRILLDFDLDPDRVHDEVIRRLSGPYRETTPRQRTRIHSLRAEAQADVQGLEPEGPAPRASVGGAARWEYGVKQLEGSVETWPDQLSGWRDEGWELLSMVSRDDTYFALLERRV